MEIIILGSGTSTGVPMVGCNCQVCMSGDPRDRRTRASVLIRHAGRNILVDTSTDLRCQMLREGVGRIDAVLFTHAHADHVNGIDDLRGFYFQHREVIPCYACESAMVRLVSGFRYIFEKGVDDTHPPLLKAMPVSGMFELFGLQIIPIPLQHGAGFSCGYRIGDFAYLTDCSAVPQRSESLLEGLNTLVIDGLRWTEHPFHYNIEGAIQTGKRLKVPRIILTHLTHEVSHAEETRLPSGVEFAFDGLKLQIHQA
jgi:phosphoribosyl 1,2-cyclic phosphate phosphodiesterase